MIFGAGIQARSQLQAVCAVRNIRRAYVFGRTPENTATFAQEMSESLRIPVSPVRGFEVLREADIICTATSATEPLFSHADVPAGVHINAIGSYQPDVREIPGETVLAAKVVVDQRAACLSEAGDLLIPLNAGHLDENHIYAEIGEIAAGQKPGRQQGDEITLFKSVGNAVQDLAAAGEILKNAGKLGLGTELYL
ncbi:MAG: ornithine cyclodeaminase family protein [Calditrichaeota bacterium]|nr:MAG: ornithine cyclodeaminase family protein [Calditrichota bacterium]